MELILPYLGFAVGFNLVLFLIAYIFQTDKITDISYSLTFVAMALFAFSQSEKSNVDLLLLGLVLIWGIRLGSFLAYRVHLLGRDQRFDEIRKRFISFLGFWVMQGLTCFIVLVPVLLTMEQQGKEVDWVVYLGGVLALLGWSIESMADYQKFRFKNKYPHRFMQSGLWSRIQHPNYTGELFFWWSIFILSLPFVKVYFSMIGPLWISFIILRFSGVSILQKKWKKVYGSDPEFIKYQERSWKVFPFVY